MSEKYLNDSVWNNTLTQTSRVHVQYLKTIQKSMLSWLWAYSLIFYLIILSKFIQNGRFIGKIDALSRWTLHLLAPLESRKPFWRCLHCGCEDPLNAVRLVIFVLPLKKTGFWWSFWGSISSFSALSKWDSCTLQRTVSSINPWFHEGFDISPRFNSPPSAHANRDWGGSWPCADGSVVQCFGVRSFVFKIVLDCCRCIKV